MRKVVTDEVNEWLKAGIVRRVRYPTWVANRADAFWPQECKGDIPETGGLCLQGVDRGKPRSKDFRWTEAAEAAFLEMKKLVSKLPTLTTPKKGETLMMYLAAASEAVSAVLLTKRNGRQMPIHYVSRSLQGAKINYAPMEKLVLALVDAARRLRRYFQAHPIKVITDSPIGQVLNNSGASGILAKWAVELGAYGIMHVPRVAIKGQVLADFVTPLFLHITAEANLGYYFKVQQS
ncbi:reverse transcriptase domain-containing protein [Tanacetum coccineum]